MRLFIDTGPIVARHNKEDYHHNQANATLDKIASGKTSYTKLYTSDYIIDESITVCRSRTHSHAQAIDLGEAILHSKSIVLLKVEERIFSRAWELFKERKEVELSFTDCTSATLAKTNGIIDIYTYDRHDFRALGFNTISEL
ncbi:type II toxin-antitoxin system VapC family toxin [Candidatus Bathyarchaeota archaeon]|nr:MAG: type II toxin-antitoxin system VapC family toxin [Candidatus Bathyarchaeota archaeon]